MTNSENITRQYQQAFNSHDLERIRQLLHPQFSFTGSDGQKKEGIQAGVEIAAMFINAFPDIKLEVKNMLTVGELTVSEFDAQGTQKGRFMNINPTNRRVSLPVCHLVEVRDNKIYSEREYFDTARLLQQLGVQIGQSAPA